MLRFQQETVLCGVLNPACSYQPPWTDKNFYLMDGSGQRQIIVDESNTPWIYNLDDPRKKEYLRPTAGLLLQEPVKFLKSPPLYHLRQKNLAVPIVFKNEYRQVYETDQFKKEPGWYRGDKPKLANPTIINRDWEEVTKSVRYNLFETVYRTWKEVGEQKLKKKRKREEEGGDRGDETMDNMEVKFPQEVWEVMIPFLDGITYLRLLDGVTNSGMYSVILDAFRANDIANKDPGFWRRTILQDMQKQHCYEIVSSYSNSIKDRQRLARVDFKPFYDAAAIHTSRDAVVAEHEFIQKIRVGELIVKSMKNLERKIKTNLQLQRRIMPNTETFNGKLVPREEVIFEPQTIVLDTLGSLCYYIINPFPMTNLFIMEDLDKCEERRLSSSCNGADSDHRIMYTKIMYFPTYKVEPKSEELSGAEKLPEVDRLLFSVCRSCTTVRAVDSESSGFVCKHVINAEETKEFFAMEPIVAFHEDVFVLWHSPMAVEFHQIKPRRTHYADVPFQQLFVWEANKYWNLLCNYTQYFIPILKKVYNSGSNLVPHHFIETYFGAEEAKKDHYYELQFVNMRLGTDTISVKNNARMERSEHTGNVQPYFKVYHRNPQYYYYNALEERSLLDVCYSGCFGHDLYVFWNHKALACSWGDGLIWMFHSWKRALAALTSEVPSFSKLDDLFVSQICVISGEVIAAAINHNLVIFKASQRPGNIYKNPRNDIDSYQDEPKFTMEPLRLVILDLMSKELSIDQMTFSFDKGEPYFLIVYRDKKGSALDFWVKRLCFKMKEPEESTDDIPEEILLESVFTSVQEDINRTELQGNDVQCSTTKDVTSEDWVEEVVRVVVGCKLLNLKQRVDATDDPLSNQEYAALVDEILLDSTKQHLLDVNKHPTLLSEAQRLVEALKALQGRAEPVV